MQSFTIRDSTRYTLLALPSSELVKISGLYWFDFPMTDKNFFFVLFHIRKYKKQNWLLWRIFKWLIIQWPRLKGRLSQDKCMDPLAVSIWTQLKDSCFSYISLLLNVDRTWDNYWWHAQDKCTFSDKMGLLVFLCFTHGGVLDKNRVD